MCTEMAASLDMALDDIIRSNRPPTGRGRRLRPAAGVGGPSRRFPHRASLGDAMPYTARPPMMPVMAPIWEQQMSVDGRGTTDHGTGIKLYISNLDYGVSNDDIMYLFSSVGDLLRHSIHCDRSGRSKGTAEVVFAREADAIAAIKRYNNVRLDGKPMMIEIVGKNLINPVPILPTPNSILGRPPSIPARGQVMGVERPTGSGIGRRHPWDKGQAKAGRSKPSAEDLDADLERYRSEALKIK